MVEFIVIFIGSIALGLMIGAYVGVLFRKPDGELIVDDSLPETTHWGLQVMAPIETVPKKKRIIFSVKVIR